MEIITYLSDLIDSKGREFVLPTTKIDQMKVVRFAESTGGVDGHNFKKTSLFKEGSVAHGFLSLSLFAEFESKVVKISNLERMNRGVRFTRFIRPVYVDMNFIPTLKVNSVKILSDCLQIIWSYELKAEDQSTLLSAVLEWRYYQI